MAPAKVNLYLHVTGRRADGLHLLDSLVVFAAAADRVTASSGKSIKLQVAGDHGAALANEADNLVLRAARRLAEAAGTDAGARLVLDKRLPLASGIGGGSADAAATLRLLQRLWGASLPPSRLHDLAARLGADVPVCLTREPAVMSGIGEILRAGPRLPVFGLVLVNPLFAVSTPDVFRARQGAYSPAAALPAAWPDAVAMARDLARLGNDLEEPARRLCSAIDGVLAALRATPGCLLARMSGSGATCFGIWAEPEAARKAADKLAKAAWWTWGGGPFVP